MNTIISHRNRRMVSLRTPTGHAPRWTLHEHAVVLILRVVRAAAPTRTQMRQSVITGPFHAIQRCRMKFIIAVQLLAASMRCLCWIGNRELFPPLEVALPMSSRSLVRGLPGRREIHWLRALSCVPRSSSMSPPRATVVAANQAEVQSTFHGMLLPSAKHSRFLVWWEDTSWEAVRSTFSMARLFRLEPW